MEISESLLKQNKLKRFAGFVAEKIGAAVGEVLMGVDTLFGGDIYTRRDMMEKLAAITDCASIVELRKYDTGEIKVHNANYCHNPVVCPVCADRVSKRRKSIFSEPIKRAVRKFAVNPCCGGWKAEYPAGYTGVYMATATIRGGAQYQLKERIDTLQDSILNMRKMGQKRKNGKRSGGEFSKIKAALQNVEIKIGQGSDGWHVHAHFLIFTDSPIDIRTKDSPYLVENKSGEKITVSKFNYEWFLASSGEGINFDVRPIAYRENVNGIDCPTFEDSVAAQASEVLKYSAQLSSGKGTGILTAYQYVELIQRRGNRRLFNCIGLFRCDKRNPESFTTVTERELKRLEYVEAMDKKIYEIFSSIWQNGGTYGQFEKQNGAVFANSDDISTKFMSLRRRSFMAQTAIYQGEYRKARNDMFKNRINFTDSMVFEDALNSLRDSFRNKCNTLWSHFKEKDFLPEYLTDFNSTGMQGLREDILKMA